MSNLISLIVPCYNVSATIEKYFDSILSQTYRNIEIIAVDDGSKDRTGEIIDSYTDRFAANGMKLIHVTQANRGLGGAINTGLKYVTGDFLCWSDPDDFYYPEAMEMRLNALLDHPEYAVVTSDADVYTFPDLSAPTGREASRLRHNAEENQFELLLSEKSIFCAGCHMVRMSAFDKANPDREIFTARRGQNWQMLLPVYYKFKRMYIDKPLYAYVVYPSSMSSGDITEKSVLTRLSEHKEIIIETLKRIPMPEDERLSYMKMTDARYALKHFYTAIDFRDKKLLHEQYDLLKQYGENTPEIDRLYRRNRSVFGKIYYRLSDSISKLHPERTPANRNDPTKQ